MAFEPFNLAQLRLVVSINEKRSFSRAAAALDISQSAVSQQIRSIEQTLGRRLFERAPNGLHVTADGEAYLVYARAMLTIGEDAKRHFSAAPLAGEIRLGLTEDFARTALPAALALFSRDHPHFGFFVDCGQSSDLFTGLEEGRYDLIVAKRVASPTPSTGRLWSEPMGWYGRPDTPCPVGDPVDLVLIPAPSVSRAVMVTALQQAGRPWRAIFQCSSFATLEAVVRAGVGISAFGRHFIAPGLVELGEEAGLPALGEVELVMMPSPKADSAGLTAFCDLVRHAALATAGGTIDGDPGRPDPDGTPEGPARGRTDR